MKIKKADFVISNTDIKKCPEPTLPEYAFIGRSNVGKSSLINMLVERKNLAKTSGRPGKTQLINHFIVNEDWYIVDLPGYGFAKTSKENRYKWTKFIEKYLRERTNLMNTFVLIDSRLPPQENDLAFMNWLGTHQIPFAMVFTKSDKLASAALQKNLNAYKKKMMQFWAELPPVFISSSTSKLGREKILNYVDQINKSFL